MDFLENWIVATRTKKKPVQRPGCGKLKSTDVGNFAVLNVVQGNNEERNLTLGLTRSCSPHHNQSSTLGSFSGSRINTDGFPHERRIRKLLGRGRGHAPPWNCLGFSTSSPGLLTLGTRLWDFNSLKSPFLGFLVIQSGYGPDFSLESFFHEKFIYLWKLWLTFVKRWKQRCGMSPRLVPDKLLVLC